MLGVAYVECKVWVLNNSIENWPECETTSVESGMCGSVKPFRSRSEKQRV